MSEENFDRIAEEYDESLPAHVVEHYLSKRVELIGRAAPVGQYLRLLDVGCGTGALAGRLAARGYKATGIDPSEGMLAIMESEHPEVEAIRARGDELPFSNDSFDVVVTVAALHHVAERDAVRATLAEMVRVSRPGGRIVVWDHNPRNPYWKLLMARVPQDDGSERLIPEQEVIGGLISAGALIVSSDQLGFVPDFVPPALLKLAQTAERAAERTPGVRRLCAHNIVVATKG